MKDFYAHKLIKDNIININEIINASQELKVKNKFTTNQEHIYEVKSNEIINHTCFNNLMLKLKI